MKLRNFLCATDFSECSGHALRRAVVLARQFGARLCVVHVMVPRHQDLDDEDIQGPEDAMRLLRERAASELESFVTKWAPDAPDLERGVVAAAYSGPAILEMAAEGKFDLIVLGTHGGGGLRRLLLGSTAEEVVQRAPCAVLTQPLLTAGESLQPLKRALVPIDFSELSEQALAFAAKLARHLECRLQLLHVLEQPIYPDFYGRQLTEVFQQQFEALEGDARDALERLVGPDGSIELGVPYDTHVVRGRVASSILRFAESHETDLIITPTRGLTGSTRFLLGSTAEQVVRLSHCPVLSAKDFAPLL